MSEAKTLRALAERVEALTGPNDEVDRLIHFQVVHPWLTEKAVRWRDHPEHDHGWFLWWTAERDAQGAPGYTDRWDLVTASLDAALTLVPEGWHASVNTAGGARCWAKSTSRSLARYVENEVSPCATPALALTAACLRARAALAADEGGTP